MRHVELDARSSRRAPRGGCRQDGPLGRRTFDDGFVDVRAGAEFVLAGGGACDVRFDEGYPAAQIFAPATDDVVCFER